MARHQCPTQRLRLQQIPSSSVASIASTRSIESYFKLKELHQDNLSSSLPSSPPLPLLQPSDSNGDHEITRSASPPHRPNLQTVYQKLIRLPAMEPSSELNKDEEATSEIQYTQQLDSTPLPSKDFQEPEDKLFHNNRKRRLADEERVEKEWKTYSHPSVDIEEKEDGEHNDNKWEGMSQNVPWIDGIDDEWEIAEDIGTSTKLKSGRVLTATEKAASKILDILGGDWSGCSSRDHDQALALHLACEENHHGLSTTYRGIPNPTASLKATEVGLSSLGFPKNCNMPRAAYTCGDTLENTFGGKQAGETERNVCLHMELSPATISRRVFDLDSAIIQLQTLGAIKTTLRWCPAKQVALNIQADLHMDLEVDTHGPNGQPQRRRIQPRNIPHLFLGTVDGVKNGNLYLFCPRLYEESRQTNFLTNEQAKRFTDIAMLPACVRFMTVDRIQHYPLSHRIAELNSRAKGVEQRTQRRSQHQQQFLSTPLPPDHLKQIWKDVISRISDPVNCLGDFQGSFLLLNVKGIKLDCKVDSSLSKTMISLEKFLLSLINFEEVENAAIDIGGETCPVNTQSTPSWPSRDDIDMRATTYLWKACCLQSIYKSLAKEYFDGKKGNMTLYNVGMLRDAACMSVVPPKTSWISQEGLLYGQWYGSVKEICDAGSSYPFDFDSLPELAVDCRVWQASATHAKLRHAKDRDFIVGSYSYSKIRVRDSYIAAGRRCYGARCELRLTWDLFQACKTMAISRASGPLYSELGYPRSLWAIRTNSFVDFMLGNYEKLTSAIEIAAITSPTTGISLDRTRLMAVLFLYLRNFANCNVKRFPTLWYDGRKKENGGVRWGLGIERTMPTYGFGWLGPTIDWESFRFHTESSNGLAILDRELLGWIGKRSGIVMDLSESLELCFAHLNKSGHSNRTTERVWLAMAHLCFQQYRRDVLYALKDELRVGDDELVKEMDQVLFCYNGVRDAFCKQPNLISGNKTRTQTPEETLEWIWGNSMIYNRKYFEMKPFRIMYEKVCECIGLYGVETLAGWKTFFQGEFLKYHWLLPYPDCNGTLISTVKKGGYRQWWAADWKEGTGWFWARKQFKAGRPEPYPEVLEIGVIDFLNVARGEVSSIRR